VPRPKTAVKNKRVAPHTKKTNITKSRAYGGVVDIHFHGAFGIDLMRASPDQMDELCVRLWQNGVAAFCPTTLSSPMGQMFEAVTRIGTWIKSRKNKPGAIPLGLHLEGPYISQNACGAHPKNALRAFSLSEIEALWSASQGTIKILTIAPEILSSDQLLALSRWSKKHKVVLSLGHSQATEEQAKTAFDHGFTNMTHGWNALSFHHRAPGPIGAALGRKDVCVELILDQIHVAPTVIRWTCALHGKNICFVSDCVPAAETILGSWHSFGDLKIQLKDGAGRVESGHLAGGGKLLSHLFAEWIGAEATRTGEKPLKLLARHQASLNEIPLKSLGIAPKILKNYLKNYKTRWQIDKEGQIRVMHVISG